ncbi:DUF2806 domain-containing protein [Thermophilibacter sp.]|uniref:DUF2806 domain-containing protein n=1 Tax=Thermophilibacter sp. TaxID=2847309 RepID=UPI003A9147E4
MSGDLNQSASASAEANAVKLSGNTVNVNLSPVGTSDGLGALARIVRLVNPVYYERREAEARAIRAESIMSAAKLIYDEFPNMSERRAVMEAMGYRMTNEQADNVVEVLEEAQENLDSQGKEGKGLLPEARDAIVEGSKAAYDDTVRSMWARLVTGESIQPGSFSKRTMSVLSDMGPGDAQMFEVLCSMCVMPVYGNIIEFSPYVILHEDESATSFNDGAFTYGNRCALESFGLIDSSVTRFVKLEPRGVTVFVAGRELVTLENGTESEIKFSTSPVLTRSGIELARLCEVGSKDGLSYFLAKKASEIDLISRSNVQRVSVISGRHG